LRLVAITGLGLSGIGAALDFLSGFGLVTGSQGMSMGNGPQLLDGAGLFVLGIVVIVTGVFLALPIANGRMSLLGLLMEAYGILMGLASSYIPSMGGVVADAMLVVGILMFLNGILMQSRRTKRGM
jgi:hypothetical protein